MRPHTRMPLRWHTEVTAYDRMRREVHRRAQRLFKGDSVTPVETPYIILPSTEP